MPEGEWLDSERHQDILILTPLINLGELENIEAFATQILDLLRDPAIKNLVIDFHKTDYFGSSTLMLFVKLWKLVQERDGRMAFCNLSELEKEILQISKLDGCWLFCDSRDDAIAAVS